MKDEKNISAKVVTETNISHNGQTRIFTTEEKAQFEVFKNGKLPRETLDGWIRNDLDAIQSLIQTARADATVFRAIADAMYKRYQQLHATDQDHEPKRSNTTHP